VAQFVAQAKAALRRTSDVDVGACMNPWRMPLARLGLVEVAVEPAQRSRLDTYLLVGF
jgi:hypothetical protein